MLAKRKHALVGSLASSIRQAVLETPRYGISEKHVRPSSEILGVVDAHINEMLLVNVSHNADIHEKGIV